MTDSEADTVVNLMRQIEVLRDVLKGRTMSCSFCNNTAKDLDVLKAKHQDLQNAVDSIIKLEHEFVSCRDKESWMADWACAFSKLVSVSKRP